MACLCAALPAAAAEPQAPTADLTSPEAALRSYWAVLDWHDAVRRARPPDPSHEKYRGLMMDVTAGATRKFYDALDGIIAADRRTKLERKIVSSTNESPQRTVIVANVRNVTPIPAGAKPFSRFAAETREKGENFRYVLALEGTRWKILEVWSLAHGSRQLYNQVAPDYPAFVPPQ